MKRKGLLRPSTALIRPLVFGIFLLLFSANGVLAQDVCTRQHTVVQETHANALASADFLRDLYQNFLNNNSPYASRAFNNSLSRRQAADSFSSHMDNLSESEQALHTCEAEHGLAYSTLPVSMEEMDADIQALKDELHASTFDAHLIRDRADDVIESLEANLTHMEN